MLSTGESYFRERILYFKLDRISLFVQVFAVIDKWMNKWIWMHCFFVYFLVCLLSFFIVSLHACFLLLWSNEVRKCLTSNSFSRANHTSILLRPKQQLQQSWQQSEWTSTITLKTKRQRNVSLSSQCTCDTKRKWRYAINSLCGILVGRW